MTEKQSVSVRESLGVSYARVINDIIAQRILIVALLGAILHLCAGYLDVVSYPHLVPVFFQIRLVTCFILALAIALTFHPKIREHVVWVGDFSLLSAAGGMILMIALSDGAGSDYYEGVNVVIAAGLLLNSFYVWHNIVVVMLFFLAYTAACLAHPETWSIRNYFYGVFFMMCHATWVVVMTKMYRTQHYQAYLNNMKLEDLFQRADMLSKMDSLTQVCNRRYFMEILAKQFEKAKQSNRDFYLVFFDIDHFKAINDTYGHAFGDSAIQAVVRRVRQNIRPEHILGRYGGG